MLAQHDVSLVYGGGRVGLMGIVADAVLGAGGRAIGVIPEALATKEIAHDGLTELHVVSGMHERKALMATLSSAFLTLPGGIGTFEEFFEILSWAALGIHQKPIGVLNIERLLRPADRPPGPRHRPGLHPPELPAFSSGLRSRGLADPRPARLRPSSRRTAVDQARGDVNYGRWRRDPAS